MILFIIIWLLIGVLSVFTMLKISSGPTDVTVELSLYLIGAVLMGPVAVLFVLYDLYEEYDMKDKVLFRVGGRK